MNTCNNCQTQFKTCTVINGKKRNLGNRTKCLDCLPFGQRSKAVFCNCIHCDRQLPNLRSKGHRPSCCASCSIKRHKHKRKQKAVEYKGGKCSNCGYKRNINALCFHHLNPLTKSFNIASNYNRKWEVLQKELDKCILLCMNCHTETHSTLVP